jgi:hypothetical protein
MASAWRFHKKLRKCNNCGFEKDGYYNCHKVWSPEKKKQVYCGYMRVVN